MSMWDEMNLLYDNSKPFLTYLKKQGLNSALQQTDLTLKERHTIVPHVGALTVLRVIPESLIVDDTSSALEPHWKRLRMHFQHL